MLEHTNNNPDFKIIEPDGNSLKIEQIREFQNKIAEKPIISNKKVYIINDSDKMTGEAQNCLLKTLEEPPEYVTIILIGSNENAFLSTIKSRCMILHFDKIPNDKINQFLEENYSVKINSKIMLNACQGSIGKAIQLQNKQEDYEKIEQVIYQLENKDKIDILNMAEPIYKAKDDKFEVLNYMNIVLMVLAFKSAKYAKCIDNMLLNLWEQVN